MSYLVLHMDKFKRESLRGIQSHNRRERRSRSNPDIRHEKSHENCELHQPEVRDYARAVQARIEALNLPKAVRKDAVVLCGLIVTSDLPFSPVCHQKNSGASSRRVATSSPVSWGVRMSFRP